MMRLIPRHSAGIRRAPLVKFTFDGREMDGHDGEMILSALLRGGVVHLRDAPNDGAPRGAFCATGLCQECVVRIEGGIVESCRAVVRAGLDVTSLRRVDE